MSRMFFAGAALAALAVSVFAGAAWIVHVTARARAEGREAGRAELAQAVEAAATAQRARADAALAETSAKVADLEQARDQLQETYDALLAETLRRPRSGRICLDARLVRALGALGRDGGNGRARP